MPDTKLQPTSTMKSKDKSKIGLYERHKSQFIFEYHFIELVTQKVTNLKKLKFGLFKKSSCKT